MSFGFSVGDFIAVSRLANKVRKRFVDAPDQFKAISDKVKSLSNIIRDLEDREDEFSNQVLTNGQKTDLEDFKLRCHNVLSELDKLLDKYSVLDPTKSGRKSQRIWKRLKWEPDDIRELRSRLTSNITLLNAFNGTLVRERVLRLNQRQDDLKRRDITNWLSSSDFPAQQRDFLKKCQKGTGQWLLNSNEYQIWLKEPGQILFCPGIPGAGKTMITAIMIENLSESFEYNKDIGITFLYCNYKRQQEQSFEDLVTSLLKQLVQGRHSLPEEIEGLYRRHVDRETRPYSDEKVEVLGSIINGYSRVFCFVDALDECANTERQKLLSELFKLQHSMKANIFATSRFIDKITTRFSERMLIEIRASKEDVRSYLDNQISHLPPFVLKRADLQEEIVTKIEEVVDGMFLLAKLHMDSLKYKTTIKAIKVALDNLPVGFEALEAAFDEAIQRIEAQPSEHRILTERVISWMTYAKRPLSLKELQYGLAVEFGTSRFDEDNITEFNDMTSARAGLVTCSEASNTIGLVHYTTQEYFKQKRLSWMANGNAEIALACLTYLSFDSFGTSLRLSYSEAQAMLSENMFLDYALHYWGSHARESSHLNNVEQLTIAFLTDEAKVSYLSQALRAPSALSYNDYMPRINVSPVHLAVYHNLEIALTTLLGLNYFPDTSDSCGMTPLS